MIASIRKNLTFLIWKHASNKNVCISPFSLSPSLHFFSTRTQTQIDINPTVLDILLHKHDFPLELASRVASESTRVKNPETGDSTLSFLKASGFSNSQLQKILKYNPGFLCFSLENKIIPSLSVLKGLLGSDKEVIRVIRLSPRLITANLESNVVPNVEFLKSCGVPMDRVRIILSGFPFAFHLNPDIIRASAEKAKKMGLNAASKAFIYAIPTIASMSNEMWEVKLQGFRDMGFSDSNILGMFRKAPLVFCASMVKIEKIIKVLLATGKYDISSIVGYPVALRYSFEMRYEPRLRILGILESRKLIEIWPNLRSLSHSSDAEFFERFVSPYSDEVGDVYIPKRR